MMDETSGNFRHGVRILTVAAEALRIILGAIVVSRHIPGSSCRKYIKCYIRVPSRMQH